jgi:hypothetical protein
LISKDVHVLGVEHLKHSILTSFEFLEQLWHVANFERVVLVL